MRAIIILATLLLASGCTKYVDEDEDGFEESVDCDDADGSIHPLAEEVCDGVDNNCDGSIDEGLVATWYPDGDGDGWGDDAGATETCAPEAGAVEVGGDCDDTDAQFHPDAVEDDCTDPNDYNCDGSVGYEDADSDGYAACEDCDDSEQDRNPGLTEWCDDLDNDCNGYVDDDASDAVTWYMDADQDGWGNPAFTDTTCDPPLGHVTNGDDCNDATPTAHPGADELCDEIDNDCDGETDEDDAVDATTWYSDGDRDGYGNPGDQTVACDEPRNYVDNGEDCDDADDDISPDADEVCDEVDNDCDGTTDEDDATDASVWYLDYDSDDYGDASVSTRACEEPTSYVSDHTDCDDSDDDIHPGADEYCDEEDNDCDGHTDEYGAVDADTWYADADGDGYGGDTATLVACEQPSGFESSSTDCNDLDDATYPGADEVCDDEDNDCDGIIDDADADVDTSTGTEFYADSDGDGYGDAASTLWACDQPSGYVEDDTDCDDDDASVGAPFAWYADTDGDSYGDRYNTTDSCTQPSGYVADDTDCDDSDDTIGAGYTWYLDDDGDGYGDPDEDRFSCGQPTAYVDNDDDCDDTDPDAFPGAPDYCGSTDSNCDGYHNEIDVPADYTTIGAAISAASDGDTICISSGTYSENLNVSKDLTLHGTSGSAATVVDAGTASSRVFYGYDYTGGIVGLTFTGSTSTSSGAGMYLYYFEGTLDDVVITDNTNTYTYTYGVGLYIGQSEALLRDVWIYENYGSPAAHTSSSESAYGVGVYVEGSDVVFEDSYIGDNAFTGTTYPSYGYANGIGLYASSYSTVALNNSMVVNNSVTMAASSYSYCYGAGVYMSSSNESFDARNAWISGNSCEADWGQGMGLYASGASNEVTLENVVLADNSGEGSGTGTASSGCYFYGGGAYLSDVVLSMTNSSVTENTLTPTSHSGCSSPYAYGGGLYLYAHSNDPVLVNNDFSNNTLTATSTTGGGVYGSGSSRVTVDFSYNNVYNNTSTELTGLVSGLVGSYGNIAVDPDYADTTPTDSSTWDLSLSSTSSLIDAGDPSILDADGTTSDIGAHGGEYGGDW